MEYNMRKPCANCPFLRGGIKLSCIERAQEIVDGSDFPCHKTTECDEEGDLQTVAVSKHCAGKLIYHEKRGESTQMMRVCERIGMYDHTKLDMSADVIDEPKEMVE